MEKVKVKTEDLLKKLKENFKKHKELYNEALKAYHTKVEEQLIELLEKVRAGKDFSPYINVTDPVDKSSEYECAIAMLEMSTESIVELSQRQFRCYVLDEWDWKSHVLMSNTMYTE